MLDYFIEFSYDNPGSSCSPGSPGCGSIEACYIHIKHNPPVFMDRTRREAYEALDEEDQDEFITNLITINGVTEMSVTAYRIWIQKAPAFRWGSIVESALSYMNTYFEEDGLNALPGSANVDGTNTRYNPAFNSKPQ
jgi:hypothetical protein